MEHSERAREVTGRVILWLRNSPNYVAARAYAERAGLAALEGYVTDTLQNADLRGSSAWHAAQEMAPNDYGRIHWQDVADALSDKGEEN